MSTEPELFNPTLGVAVEVKNIGLGDLGKRYYTVALAERRSRLLTEDRLREARVNLFLKQCLK